MSGKFKAPEAGARAAIPIGMPLTVRPGNFLLGALPNNRTRTFACYAGREIEDIEATFDPALPMPLAPAPVTIDNQGFSYRATYRIDGRTLKVHREFVSLVGHQTCEEDIKTGVLAQGHTPDTDPNKTGEYMNAVFKVRKYARITPASWPGPDPQGTTSNNTPSLM